MLLASLARVQGWGGRGWEAGVPQGLSWKPCLLEVLKEMTAEAVRADVRQGPEHVVQRKSSFTSEYPVPCGAVGLGFGPLIYTKDNPIPLSATGGAQIHQGAHNTPLWQETSAWLGGREAF